MGARGRGAALSDSAIRLLLGHCSGFTSVLVYLAEPRNNQGLPYAKHAPSPLSVYICLGSKKCFCILIHKLDCHFVATSVLSCSNIPFLCFSDWYCCLIVVHFLTDTEE